MSTTKPTSRPSLEVFLDQPAKWIPFLDFVRQLSSPDELWPYIDPNFKPKPIPFTQAELLRLQTIADTVDDTQRTALGDPPLQRFTEQPILERPKYPTLELVGYSDPEAASKMGEQKKWLWDFYKDNYKVKIVDFDRKSKAMSELQKTILRQVAQPYHVHVRQCSDLRSILLALKSGVAYTDRAMEIDLRRQYQYVSQIGPKSATVDTWIND